MKPFSLLFGMVLAVAVIAILLLIFGVRAPQPKELTYDAGAVVTERGTVQEVVDYACPASLGELGSHLVLKTDHDTIHVHLAPARVVRSVGFTFHPGDEIEVVGSRVTYRGEAVIARDITRGQEVFRLRDASGKLLIQQH